MAGIPFFSAQVCLWWRLISRSSLTSARFSYRAEHRRAKLCSITSLGLLRAGAVRDSGSGGKGSRLAILMKYLPM